MKQFLLFPPLKVRGGWGRYEKWEISKSFAIHIPSQPPLILRGGAFILIIFSLLTFIHCGGTSSNLPPTAEAPPPRDQTIPPTRNVTRDPACPPAAQPIPFITEVVSYKIGPGGGYHWKSLPQIVTGPPRGTGTHSGSVDVFSLGQRGHMIVKMGTPILDGDGDDFIVFENVFYAGDNPAQPYQEPGIVSVSQDGISFTSFPCQNKNWQQFYPGCAGVNPVFANSIYHRSIDPTDPKTAGGDAFDLDQVGLNCVRFIKIEDATLQEEIDPTLLSELNEISDRDGDVGFDLEAISAVYY